MMPPVKKAFVLVPLLAASLAITQDMATVAPQLVKVEYEDQHVQVVHLRVPPHESVPTHERPARVVIPLSTSDVSMPRADGSVAKVRSTAGEAGWGGTTKRSFVNLDAPVDNVIVDLKHADAPANRVAAPLPSGYVDEPHLHWRFENQYVRVYDLRIPTGETTGYFKYSPETVIVAVTQGTIAAQEQGKRWGQVQKVKKGKVEAIVRDTPPRRLQNRGSGEYHAVVVQLLQ